MSERANPTVLVNWIGGVPSSPRSNAYIEDINPATGTIEALIPRSVEADVEASVRAAQEALYEGTWGQTSASERADLCDAIADELERRTEELAVLESQDTGKPVALAATVDIPRAVSNFRFFAGAVRHKGTDCFPMMDALNYTHRRPVGLVGLITPWNLPLYLLSWKTAPALAMGNAIIAKPSEVTPRTASVLAEIIHQVGVPPGVFNVVHGYGHEVGQAMVSHPDIQAISFTGGTVTGSKVAATAAPMFKKLSLELGGKNPTVIFADCDFESAVEGAVRAGFTNQGQVCLCGSRIFVERSIFDTFTSAFVEKVKAIRVGDPSHPDSKMGALSSFEHRDKVERYLELAQEEGGSLLCGGQRPELPAPFDKGAFLTPAVVSGLSPDCRTVQEEIFGPVVTLHPFDSDEEALHLANGVRYGLSASVWTRDLVRAHRFSEALDVGMVWVNTWLHRDLRVPFGGVKDSGVGREGGRHSLEFFSESSNICIHLGSSKGIQPPYRKYPQQRSMDTVSTIESGSNTASEAALELGSTAEQEPVVEQSSNAALPSVETEQADSLSASSVAPSLATLMAMPADGRTLDYEELVSATQSSSSDTTMAYVKSVSMKDLEDLTERPQSQATDTHEDAEPIDSFEEPVVVLKVAKKPPVRASVRRVGDLLFVSGINACTVSSSSSKRPETLTHSEEGFALQVRRILDTLQIALEDVGSCLEDIVDITVLFVDIQSHLSSFMRIFNQRVHHNVTITTLEVKALAEPVAIELKVIAQAS